MSRGQKLVSLEEKLNSFYRQATELNEQKKAVQILSISPIVSNILAYLGAGDTLRIQLVCKTLHSAIKIWERAAYSINRRLERFFEKPLAFRALQANTDMIISGSFALQFFDRTYYPEGDLDLYVSSKYAKKISRWVQDNGYIYKPRLMVDDEEPRSLETVLNGLSLSEEPRPQGTYPLNTLQQVLTFLRKDSPKTTVQLMLSHNDCSPLASVFGFHSTCVMNYISWNKAVSMYPALTFNRREAFIMCRRGDYHTAFAKYAKRGFRFTERAWMEDSLIPTGRSSLQPGARAIGDGQSWVIDLGTSEFDIPGISIPDHRRTVDPELMFSWHVGNVMGINLGDVNVIRNPEIGFGQSAVVFNTRIFRYKYLAHPGMYFYTAKWRGRQLQFEEKNTRKWRNDEEEDDDAMETEQADEVLHRDDNSWTPPKGWNFWDDNLRFSYDDFTKITRQENTSKWFSSLDETPQFYLLGK